MATMSEAQREAIFVEISKRWTNLIGRPSLDKAAVRAAISAADEWVSSNAASFNNALPAAYKAAASTAEKAYLLSLVALKRYAVGV